MTSGTIEENGASLLWKCLTVSKQKMKAKAHYRCSTILKEVKSRKIDNIGCNQAKKWLIIFQSGEMM